MNPTQSRQRKMLVMVLVMGLGGLVVDRLVLGGGATGPDEASADAITPSLNATPAAPGGAAPIAIPTVATRAKTLAGRLDRTAEQERFELLNVDDAFAASPLWVKPPKQTEEEKSKAKPATEAEAFVATHKLMAVINNPTGGAAIIGNQTVLVGKTIDGFTLIRVTKRSAILEKGQVRVEISLPEPRTGPTKSATEE